jgi:3-methylcrotonyl-CoA carboxylase beta subunit
MDKLISGVNELRAKAREGGGKAVLERWKARGKGKLGARER